MANRRISMRKLIYKDILVLFCRTNIKEVKFMSKRRVAMTVSLPPEMAKEYESLAKRDAKNKSELFREMFQLYKRQTLEKEFFELQRYGVALAQKKRVFTEEDVERTVFEGR